LYVLDAVGARFKIDPDRFDEFFRACLRRTLAQMLCDVRRELRWMNVPVDRPGGGFGNAAYGIPRRADFDGDDDDEGESPSD